MVANLKKSLDKYKLKISKSLREVHGWSETKIVRLLGKVVEKGRKGRPKKGRKGRPKLINDRRAKQLHQLIAKLQKRYEKADHKPEEVTARLIFASWKAKGRVGERGGLAGHLGGGLYDSP